MRIMLEEDLAGSQDLAEVGFRARRTLSELRDDGFAIHYVAGPISCDGEDRIAANLEALIEARTRVMKRMGDRALVFTAPFIFTPEVYAELGIFNMPKAEREAELQRFWDELIVAGVIDGIHFTDGWQRSPGARRERQTAEELGVPVFDVAS